MYGSEFGDRLKFIEPLQKGKHSIVCLSPFRNKPPLAHHLAEMSKSKEATIGISCEMEMVGGTKPVGE